MNENRVYWLPQAGPQTEAFTCPADELFAGGERGGGKSQLIIGREVTGALRHAHAWNGIIFRKKYKDFKEIRIDFDRLIHVHGLPATRVGGENQINFIKYKGGGTTTLAQAGSLKAVEDWQGHQFTHVSIDEAQQFPYLTGMMSLMKGSTRSAYGIRPRMLLTGNPGGPGASQIKNMFIPLEYGGDVDVREGRVQRVEIQLDDGSVAKVSRVFIQLPLTENRILLDGDPGYINRLKSIPDAALRAAWLDGRWDVFIGQAFNFSKKNILERPIWPIPEYSPIFMTFDYGFGAPFSAIWWWVDSDRRVYAFHEWYGGQKALPNIGLRLTDDQIISGLLEREEKLGLIDRRVTWLMGPDCFRKKADYKGGGQGPATSDVFREYLEREDIQKKYGKNIVKARPMIPGDSNRETKIRQFRNRLAQSETGEFPMLMVYPDLKHFIRTIPALVTDEVNPEDIEDGQEDHTYDSACHICQYYPIGITQLTVSAIHAEEERQNSKKKLDSASAAALEEWEKTIEALAANEEAPSWLV